MINVSRVFKEYSEAGAMHELVGIQYALGDGVFSTKSGDLVKFLAFRGVDDECLDPDETNHVARRFESVMRSFDERFRIYQYHSKRTHPALPAGTCSNPIVQEAGDNRLRYLETKALYSFETHLAVVYEGGRPKTAARGRLVHWITHPQEALREALSDERTRRKLEEELRAAQEVLTHKVAAVVTQLRDILDVQVLDEDHAFGFLRRLLNYAPHKADGVRLKSPSLVDYQACGSSLECHRGGLRLDDDWVQVLTLKEPPARTSAHLLRDLQEIPCNALIVTEWKREDALAMRRLIQSKRRHFHNLKTSLATHLSPGPSGVPPDRLIDDGAVATVADLGGCLEEMEVHGRYFGRFTLTIVLSGPNEAQLRRAVAQCIKVFAAHDAQLTEERYNRLNAWLSIQPGNSAYNLRHLWMLNTNYADLSLLYAPDPGRKRNDHLDAEYLAILEGSGGAPFFFNLHDKDVAHTFISGATGSGKSFLLNFLLTHLQKYNPYTFIFDLGGSYANAARLFGGSYLAIGSEKRSCMINPFCLAPTKDNLLFLFVFVRVLIETNGYRMSAEEEQDLYEQIENIYEVGADQRRLFTLSSLLHKKLRAQLAKWVEGGPFATLFDNAEDNLTLARFQVFEFEGMDRAPDLREALLFYILHRANAALNDDPSAFKVAVMDEAWRFFRHPAVKAYIVEALKTWRKKNAAMILATQSSEDLLASEMLPVVVESCPTKLFLANPGINREAYKTIFHLNETEADLIAGLVPKQQILIKQPDRSKLASLNVDPKGYWLYTNSPRDDERRRQAFERYGFREGLEILARENT